jgi:hypothetical protein
MRGSSCAITEAITSIVVV